VLADFAPGEDQPASIADLTTRIQAGGSRYWSATGTAKSATTAWLIDRVQPPTLVMAPNTAPAAQLAVWQPVEHLGVFAL
jgi:excinuclease UvrABC helicase subunit UvrB